MNLHDYIKRLQEFVNEHPEALEKTVIYARDDEGNGHDEVYYTGTLGLYEDKYFLDYNPDDPDSIKKEQINAVCIN